MKAMRKLIPALAMLLVSVVVMSSASFAWFTMSRQVTAQGMNVTVTAPNNLMIKATGAEDSTYAELTTASATGVVLVPASTTTGRNNGFYVVKNGEAVVTNTGALKTGTKLQAGTAATNSVEGAYYDFTYTIKSDGGQTVNVVVASVTATLTETSPSGTSAKPIRVAVMKADQSGLRMFNPNSGAHHTPGQAVSGIAESTEVATKADATYTTPATLNNDANTVVTLTSETPTADIIIRVWYEGEDTECTVAKGKSANFDISVVLADVASLPAPSAS